MRFWFALVLATLCVAAPPARVWADEGDDSDLEMNDMVDQVLDMARAEIANQRMDQVALPDITEKFKKKVGPISISGRFQARDGWVKSLASLQRTGDATMSEDGDRIIVEVPLGLSDLQIGYGYKAKLGKLGPGGQLTATVNSNAVTLRASLLLTDDACSLGVDSLVLNDLGKINVHVTGLGKLNFLYSKIVTWVTSKLHDKIEDAVQKGLRDAINKAGLKLDCNSLFGM
ncbi:Mite allergen Der p 7 [Frankliniella fusca]|uniref:Mite allergen Der p 7 n=1 Tax=Frankliniella fusca TaxID=407009 RepID=A0AAE1HLR7_9NEOP|nr:Mite allergen Der p 7 [Frankliniella fusca]